jgi:uncharacterized membrane protein
MANDRDSRIEAKLDTVVEKISEIKVTLGEQHISLNEHMRRTELLEKEIKPLQKQHTIINFCAKLVTMIFGSALVVAIIRKLLA